MLGHFGSSCWRAFLVHPPTLHWCECVVAVSLRNNAVPPCGAHFAQAVLLFHLLRRSLRSFYSCLHSCATPGVTVQPVDSGCCLLEVSRGGCILAAVAAARRPAASLDIVLNAVLSIWSFLRVPSGDAFEAADFDTGECTLQSRLQRLVFAAWWHFYFSCWVLNLCCFIRS